MNPALAGVGAAVGLGLETAVGTGVGVPAGVEAGVGEIVGSAVATEAPGAGGVARPVDGDGEAAPPQPATRATARITTTG
jgi:hypothetical protein